MREKLRFLGLDVHAETIAVAVAEPDGEVRSLGTIANREDSIRKFIRKLGPPEHLRACYEAGPTGFVLYWQLTQLGVDCAVVAPSLVPKKPGDRVKTDRRDALKLARSHRSGDLTAVWVPDEDSEALRDIVRQREAAKQDQLRARHRLTKFLLRTGQRPPLGLKAWTERYMRWLAQIRYMQPAQEACATGLYERSRAHERAGQALGSGHPRSGEAGAAGHAGTDSRAAGSARRGAYLGSDDRRRVGQHLVPLREYTEADGLQRSISQPGLQWQAHSKRRHYQVRQRAPETNRGEIGLVVSTPAPRGGKAAQATPRIPAEIIEIAWKAQNRLHKRYMKLTMAGKDQRKVMTAVARELLGFIWAIGIKAEAMACKQKMAA